MNRNKTKAITYFFLTLITKTIPTLKNQTTPVFLVVSLIFGGSCLVYVVGQNEIQVKMILT